MMKLKELAVLGMLGMFLAGCPPKKEIKHPIYNPVPPRHDIAQRVESEQSEQAVSYQKTIPAKKIKFYQTPEPTKTITKTIHQEQSSLAHELGLPNWEEFKAIVKGYLELTDPSTAPLKTEMPNTTLRNSIDIIAAFCRGRNATVECCGNFYSEKNPPVFDPKKTYSEKEKIDFEVIANYAWKLNEKIMRKELLGDDWVN